MPKTDSPLHDDLPIELVCQIDAVARRAERAWRDGGQVPIEDCLQQVDAAGRSALLQELLWLEAEQAALAGRQPNMQTWLERFPNDAETVQQFIEEWTTASAQPRFPTIPGYTLQKQLGRGATGVVYLAVQDRLQRQVAVKVVAAGVELAKAAAIIKSEAEAIARLRHPNIVQVYETGLAKGEPFLTLEYVAGESLREWLLRRPVFQDQAVVLIEQLARAIHHAHTHGIIHRDLKPANILLMPVERPQVAHAQESFPVPKITDFGLAKVLDELQSETRTGAIQGTPKYMAPEQAQGGRSEIGPGADIYALGVILFELLTGKTPFESESTLELLKQLVHNDAAFPADIQTKFPADLQAICLKCLEKSPANRYASAWELAEDLQRFRQDIPITARKPSRYYHAWKFIRRHRGMVASLSVIFMTLLLASISISLFAWREAQARHRAERLAGDEQIARAHIQVLHQQDRRNLYWANLRMAQQAWQDARLEAMCEHLEAVTPSAADDKDMRGFEWYYLWRLSHPSTFVFEAQSNESALTFGPRGICYAAANERSCILLIDSKTGKLLDQWTASQDIFDLAVSPDGKWLALARRDSTVEIRDLATHQVSKVLRGHDHPLRTIAFSPDNRYLASGDETSRAVLWELETGQELWNLTEPELYVMKLSFSRDGRWLAVGSGIGKIRIMDTATGQVHRQLAAHTPWLTGLAFSPTADRLATCGADRTIKVWDIGSDKAPLELKGHRDWVTAVAFSQDGQTIGSCSRDGTVELWHANSGEHQVTLMGHSSWVMDVVFSHDDSRIASTSIDGTVRIWTPDANWEARTLFQGANSVASLKYLCDGKHLLVGSINGDLRLLDATTGELEWDIAAAHADGVGDIAVTADEQKFVTASLDNDIKLFRTKDQVELLRLTGHTDDVRTVAFCNQESQLISTGNDGTLRLWDLLTGAELKRLDLGNPGDAVSCCVREPYVFVAVGNDVTMWDITTWQKIKTFSGHTRVIQSVAISQDGKTLASGGLDRTICLWDVNSGQKLHGLNGHSNLVKALAFCENDRRLASCGDDGSLRYWDTETGRELLTLNHHRNWINCLAIAPNERTIATGSHDHSVKLIQLD